MTIIAKTCKQLTEALNRQGFFWSLICQPTPASRFGAE